MVETYIKTDNASQEEISLFNKSAKSWMEVAQAVREKIRRLEAVARAFEEYQEKDEPFIGESNET